MTIDARTKFIFGSIIVTILVAFVPIGFLVDKNASWISRIVLAALALALTSAAIFVSDEFSNQAGQQSWKDFVTLRMGAFLLLALQVVFGFLTDAVGLMKPTEAVEDEPLLIQRAVTKTASLIEGIARDTRSTKQNTDAIKETTDRTANSLQKAGIIPDKNSVLIEEGIKGVWGTDSCRIKYSFAWQGKSLLVKELDPFAGMGAKDFLFIDPNSTTAILGGVAQPVLTVSEKSGLHKSSYVTFTLIDHGAFQELIWDSRNDDQPTLTLERCL